MPKHNLKEEEKKAEKRPKRIVRGVESNTQRELRRIALTVDSHLRQAFGLPLDPTLTQPFPVPAQRAREFLELIACSTRSDNDSEHEPSCSGPSAGDA